MDTEDAAGYERAHRLRLELLHGVREVQRDPARLVEIVRASGDDADALRAIERAYGVGDATARAMLDMPFARLTGVARRRAADEVAALEHPRGDATSPNTDQA